MAAAPSSRPVDELGQLPSGRPPTVVHLAGSTIVTPAGRRVRVRLPGSYAQPRLLGRRAGEWVVYAYDPDGDLPDQFGVFGVSRSRTRLITTYTNARELFSPYLLPGSDTLYLVSDGADSYNPLSYRVSLRTGRDLRGTFTTTTERSSVLGVDPRGVLFEVRDRVVRWGPRGARTVLLDDREHAAERTLLAVVTAADLVAFAVSGGVSWRRLSDPSVELWTSPAIADDPRVDPLALSPDGRRLVTREAGELVVRRTADGHVVSSTRLVDGAHDRDAHLGAVAFEDDRTFLVEVERSRRLHAGILRCTVAGRCAYAVPSDADAYLSRF